MCARLQPTKGENSDYRHRRLLRPRRERPRHRTGLGETGYAEGS
jgi:hypothetical protein